MSIGRQIAETLRTHESVGKAEARDRALAMLEAVQIRDPERVYDLYPHEVSGGMGQRVMIAMMLIAEPGHADRRRADLGARRDRAARRCSRIIDELVSERGMGLIFISHDLRLVSSFCDRVLVMYAGQVVEELPAGRARATPSIPTRAACSTACRRIGDDRHPLPVLDRKPEWAA